jgi:Helix-turn-helix domain/RodZ C-terminal domain
MASRIGSDLHRARTRREIELSEVEAATRIRARFLRALEAEEWDALPGGVYTRGFIRTYANFLSLDGDRLAEDYRRDVEGARPPDPAPVVVAPGNGRANRLRALPWPALIAVAAVTLLVGIAVFVLPGNGGGGRGTPSGQAPQTATGVTGEAAGRAAAPQPTAGVSMRLTANAEVWVCVLDAGGKRLVGGQILEAGAAAGPFHSDSFTLSFGNGEVTMLIDGKEAEIPPTSSPIGYSIDSSGQLTELSESERPTCT